MINAIRNRLSPPGYITRGSRPVNTFNPTGKRMFQIPHWKAQQTLKHWGITPDSMPPPLQTEYLPGGKELHPRGKPIKWSDLTGVAGLAGAGREIESLAIYSLDTGEKPYLTIIFLKNKPLKRSDDPRQVLAGLTLLELMTCDYQQLEVYKPDIDEVTFAALKVNTAEIGTAAESVEMTALANQHRRGDVTIPDPLRTAEATFLAEGKAADLILLEKLAGHHLLSGSIQE